MSQINVTINGKLYKTDSDKTILNFCKEIGIEIPTLCHDPRLEPYSSCYLCVVEVEGARGLQTSCSTKLTEGMVIETDNARVHASRKTALDLLQSNHFASCQAPCKSSCPAGVDVQGYISLIEKGLYHEAVKLIKEVNPLPAICGRVCVRPCEAACNRNYLEDEGAPVGIDYMKRFISDYDLYSEEHYKPEIQPSTGKKVAVIGAGPGGLSAAYFLQQQGHQVDIFEANNHAGGWLRYGIPEYRLPNDLLDKEIETITELGTNIFLNKRLGENLSYQELKENYDSTILTIGAQRGTLLGVEGEDADGVFSGIDFLRNMEQTGQKYNFTGKTVIVVGGGNTAMDCCRTSIRCKAEKTYVIYRRTEKEMPANPIEIHESKLEGVEYLFLTNPTSVNKDKNGKLESITCVKMELGEPDASGRRRPIPMEGSEFEINADYILAAIGQKVQADFVEDINKFAQSELKLNRWGTIEANEKTLQTDVKEIFAAGDGVTGAATIIEAIAQAGIAARSCHQFIMGEDVKPKPKEFLSKKSNFVKVSSKAFAGKFEKQLREEMPVLSEDLRLNFNEVELGYTEEMALNETARCFECGCTEYFNCDLKDYSTEYGAEQEKYKGDFLARPVDFSHSYIEIDNNKCILCSRCVRICKDVVGAGALGLVNRGFDTFVAPSLGMSLNDTDCESCGLCISTCPTGAITENVKFKAGPVKTDSFDTICNYCSVGCKLTIHHRNGFVMKVTGAEGLVNKDTNHCKFGKFGYSYFNDKTRITNPMLKVNGEFKEISFKEALSLISDKIKTVKPNENAFYAGARLTNEEIYLVQKLARAGAKTNNISSFHYAQRENGYVSNAFSNVPFGEIEKAGKVYLFGSETNKDNGVVGFMIQNAKTLQNVSVDLITMHENSSMQKKVDQIFKISSYYKFIKAVNYFLLSNNQQNRLFIDAQVDGFEEYKKNLLSEDFEQLVKDSGVCCSGTIINFATDYNKTHNAIIVFSEKEVSANTSFELQNLALLTGKLGKTANGIISLKEKNNSQALFDMGSFSELALGAVDIKDTSVLENLKNKWKLNEISDEVEADQFSLLEKGEIKNAFIFGEDPIGTAVNADEMERLFKYLNFVVVQDYFMTPSMEHADLILPASFPTEIGGSFTNTQKVIQEFEKADHFGKEKLELNSYQQLIELLKKLGVNGLSSRADVFSEIISLLPQQNEKQKLQFHYTEKSNMKRRFEFGCDSLVKRFEEEFEKSFAK